MCLRYYGKNTLWMFALHSLVILAVMAAVRGLTGEAYRPMFGIPHRVSVPAAIVVTALLAPVGALGSLAKMLRLRGRADSAAAQNDEKTEKDRVR